MSWNNVLSADLLLDLARQHGIYTQLELDLPRYFTIDEDFLCDVIIAFYEINGKGQRTGSHSNKDHPAFAALRDHLEREGMIKTQRQWWNGDRVLKPFYLNNVLFEEGDQFLSASPMKHHLQREQKRLNNVNERREKTRAV